MSQEFNRRDVLKAVGVTVGMSLVSGRPSFASDNLPGDGNGGNFNPLGQPKGIDYIKPTKPVTCIINGAGSRGNVYASYAAKFPDEMKVVGVSEPIPHRNESMAKAHSIPDGNRFVTWEHVFDKPKFADVAVISTPDALHYGPAMKALSMGYDLLLEKPIAQQWSQCRDIYKLTKKKDAIVGVCHVLRYNPYYRQLKHIIDSGMIGKVISIQHIEPVQYAHNMLAYVRGPWGNSKKSTPMLLAKSCHDLDIFRWLVDKPAKRISSFGDRSVFRKEMAPKGAAKRCTDCPVEKDCPFSAVKMYLERKEWLQYLYLDEHTDEKILQALKGGAHGLCAYDCGNDQVDHQVTNIEFDGGATASFLMVGLASSPGRRTRIFGSKGDIEGREGLIWVYNFLERKHHHWDQNVHHKGVIDSGHGGGDYGVTRDFIQAVSRRDSSLLSSSLAASMESHLMGFKAEESRHTGKTMDVNMDR
jgi:predicted dehydrogenase